jgi:glycosyltransferase involved in cell wall biosynthesis
MMTQPLVSVLLIAMNHEKFIAKACESILNQTCKNIEVVFLDNNSIDSTYEIGEEILKNSQLKSYVGIKNFENKGISANLNSQLKKANGDYILILSGDDWLEINAIERKINYLTENNLDVLYSDGYRFIEKTQSIKTLYSRKKKKIIMSTISDYYNHNLTNNLVYSVGFFTKTAVLRQNQFDENIHMEDWDIALRLSKNGCKMGFINEKIFYYRILETSLSHNFSKMKHSYIEITNKYLKDIESNESLYKKHLIKLLEFQIQEAINENISNIEIYRLQKKRIKMKYENPKRSFKILVLFLKELIS